MSENMRRGTAPSGKSHDASSWWLYVLLGVVILGLLAASALLVMAISGVNILDGLIPTAASLTVVPEEGSAGTFVTVIGRDWRAGDLVTLHLLDPKSNTFLMRDLDMLTVKEDGTFVASFTFPAGIPAGNIAVQAVSTAAEDKAEVRFDVVASTLTPTPQAMATLTSTATPTPSPTLTPTPVTLTPTPTSTPRRVTLTPTAVVSEWRGEYYNNRNLTGAPVLVRGDRAIDFSWGKGAPGNNVAADSFSVRWTRAVNFTQGTYRFYVSSDDGVRVWVDGSLIIDQWHDASGTLYTADRVLSSAPHALRVEYYENKGSASVAFWWERAGDFPEWRAEYFSNATLSGNPVLVRNDKTIDFDWAKSAPASGLPADNFSVRWTRTLSFDEESYRFYAIVDDGVRIFVDGRLLLDQWFVGARREVSADIALSKGNHVVRVEYYESTGDALLQVRWEKTAAFPDWKGEYWGNRKLEGQPVFARNDKTLDFDWGKNSPDSRIPADNFSVRWTRNASFDTATYRFRVVVDDGARLWVDNQLVIDAWEDGSEREVTGDLALSGGAHALRLDYFERSGETRIHLWWEKITPSFPDWKGEYWSNSKFSGSPALTRNDKKIDFNWGTSAPASGLPANDFTVRWSRTMKFDAGIYRFSAIADDGIRIKVDGTLILSEWHSSPGQTTYRVDVPLAAGNHGIVVEYYEEGNNALAKVWIDRVSDLITATPTPTLTRTPTLTPPTATATPTATPTATTQPPTVTSTATPTATTQPPTATSTATPTATTSPPTETATPTPTATSTESGTP